MNTLSAISPSPAAKATTDGDTLLQAGQQLLSRATDLGPLPAAGAARLPRNLASEIRNWLRTAEDAMPTVAAGHLLRLTDTYAWLTRLLTGYAPSPLRIQTWNRRALDAWASAQSAPRKTAEDAETVSDTDAIAAIQQQLRQTPRSVDARHLTAYIRVTGAWCRQLRTADRLPGLTEEENVRRLRLLLAANLRAYYGTHEPAIKSRWRTSLP